MEKSKPLPKAFLWRRLHSVAGLWLVVFLIEHLLTNSQAALMIGNDGSGFIKSVNWIHGLPFLPLIEIFLLGVPILIHAAWGIAYIREGKQNAYGKKDGSEPSLGLFRRNKAYSWQRITSWILVIGIFLHVAHMRFIEYPESAKMGGDNLYLVQLNEDQGLATVAARLEVILFDETQIKQLSVQSAPQGSNGDVIQQEINQEKVFLERLNSYPLKAGQVIAVAPDFGTAELLIVRETFKMPIMILLYSLLVISAVYHAFNGLWTAMITWGITMTDRAQNGMRKAAIFLMVSVGFLGLAAVWGTYWINLYS